MTKTQNWRVWRRAIAAGAVASCLSASAIAQDSRSSVLEAARDARVAETTPPQRSSLDRKLYWYDNQYVLTKLLAGWKGIHLGGADFPAGAGIKFAVAFDKGLTARDPDPTLPNRVDLTAVAAYSTRGYIRGRAGVNLRNLGGAPLDLEVSGQYYEFPQEDFFGLGRGSLEDNRTNYLLDSVEAAARLHWRPTKFLDFGGGGAYLAPRVGRGTDSRFPTVESSFDPATIPGFTAQPDFIRADASAAFDWRDNPLLPHAGGRYGITASNFSDRDLDTYDFRRVEVSLQQFVPLPNGYRTLALRAEAIFTDSDAGKQVPFYFQPTLGGAQDLRGFREFRFRDRNSFLLGAEYRWQAWWALDGAFFVDAGTVAPTRRDLSVRKMDVSYGVGFRFHSNSAFVGRLDLAFSREGFVPLLRFEHAF